MNPREIVVFYTDGLTEIFDSQGRQFGVERLIRVAEENRDNTCHDIQDAVYDAVKRFASPGYVFDYFTMIVLKRL